ncbi:hypothetical protein F7Q99_25470 [Streptomyces kaniharaensis]|uniref:ZIP family zinc transporter n=1 Tax=Streptomyces kaniharaensis TaxID=212423 RepID=A0A6N7KZ40_9ACTN|nr:hypothetical protein [Streptomyces kaniharaensis]MQS15528.1 hypothetical protein [Streptomyces kaniharaensis]
MNAFAAALWGAFAAFSLVIGAWLAVHLRPSRATTGEVLGFGAGALVAALAYELVPKGAMHNVGHFLALFAGAVVFYVVDRMVARQDAAPRRASGGEAAGRSIVVGALLDGIPESMVLGMGLAAGGSISVAFLAAVFVSNLPEALGATAAMQETGQAPRDAYRLWWSIVGVAAAAAALGYGLIRLVPHAEGQYVESFAAGAVLTMLADSMMPESFEQGGRLTGLLTVLGFAAAGALSLLD